MNNCEKDLWSNVYALLKTVGPEQWHQQHCCGVRGWAELQQSLQHRHHQQQQVKKKKCIIVRQSISHQAKMAAKNDKSGAATIMREHKKI